MATIWAFDHIENKHISYRRKDGMKKFSESLRDHARNIINFEKENMLLLTKEKLKSHQNAKVCCICGKILKILKMFSKSMNYQKLRDHYYYTGKHRGIARSICNLKFNLPNEIPVVIHYGSNYHYHFIIKELANEFAGQFE